MGQVTYQLQKPEVSADEYLRSEIKMSTVKCTSIWLVTELLMIKCVPILLHGNDMRPGRYHLVISANMLHHCHLSANLRLNVKLRQSN